MGVEVRWGWSLLGSVCAGGASVAVCIMTVTEGLQHIIIAGKGRGQH